MIHWNISFFMKYFFQTISWNAYFTIVPLCNLPRNVHDILFETFHQIEKFWKSIFRIFSIMKEKIELNYYWICFHAWLTLLLSVASQKFKRKCKHYVKASKVVFVFWEAVVQRCSVKKVLKKETLAQVFSCEFCEISKNNFFIEHLWWLLLYFNYKIWSIQKIDWSSFFQNYEWKRF